MPEATRQLAPAIPWTQIIGMRHILVHDYFGVDIEVVWRVVERDLPLLKQEVAGLLARLGN